MIWIDILRIAGVLICGINILLILEERKSEPKPDSKPTTTKPKVSSACIECSQQADSAASVRDRIRSANM